MCISSGRQQKCICNVTKKMGKSDINTHLTNSLQLDEFHCIIKTIKFFVIVYFHTHPSYLMYTLNEDDVNSV